MHYQPDHPPHLPLSPPPPPPGSNQIVYPVFPRRFLYAPEYNHPYMFPRPQCPIKPFNHKFI